MQGLLQDASEQYQCTCLNCDGSLVAGVAADGEVHVLDARSLEERILPPFAPGVPKLLTFADDAADVLVMVSGTADEVHVVAADVTDRRVVFAETLAAEAAVSVALAAGAAPAQLVAAFSSFAVIWEVDLADASWRERAVLEAEGAAGRAGTRSITQAALDGPRVVLSFDDGSAACWSSRTLELLSLLDPPDYSAVSEAAARMGLSRPERVLRFALSRGGRRRAALVNGRGFLVLWDLASGRSFHTAPSDGAARVVLGRPASLCGLDPGLERLLVLWTSGRATVVALDWTQGAIASARLLDAAALEASPAGGAALERPRGLSALALSRAQALRSARAPPAVGAWGSRVRSGPGGRARLAAPRAGAVLSARVAAFRLARGEPGLRGLAPRRLRLVLGRCGSFPTQWRALVWRLLLRLPENGEAFSALLARGEPPGAREALRGLAPGPRHAASLRAVVSCLAAWSPHLLSQPFLHAPSVAFPFVHVFRGDPLLAFEASAALLCRWGAPWLVAAPLPPLPLLRAAELLLRAEDAALSERLRAVGAGAACWCWPALGAVLTPRAAKGDWLQIMDHVLARAESPAFLLACAVALAVEGRAELWKCASREDVKREALTQRPLQVERLLKRAHRVHRGMPEPIRRYLDGGEGVGPGGVPQSGGGVTGGVPQPPNPPQPTPEAPRPPAPAPAPLEARRRRRRRVDARAAVEFGLFASAFPPPRLPWPLPAGEYPPLPPPPPNAVRDYQRREWRRIAEEAEAAERAAPPRAEAPPPPPEERLRSLSAEAERYEARARALDAQGRAASAELAAAWRSWTQAREASAAARPARPRRLREMAAALGVQEGDAADWISSQIAAAEEDARARAAAALEALRRAEREEAGAISADRRLAEAVADRLERARKADAEEESALAAAPPPADRPGDAADRRAAAEAAAAAARLREERARHAALLEAEDRERAARAARLEAALREEEAALERRFEQRREALRAAARAEVRAEFGRARADVARRMRAA